MNQQLALQKQTHSTAIAKREVQVSRLKGLALSHQVLSVVTARIQGTKIREASEEQLEDMWNQVIVLLGIKVSEEQMENHIQEIVASTAWLQQNYPKLTCEEVVSAYNLACQQVLKLDELFGIISPKHLGNVLGAYNKYMREDLEINRVFAQQLLLEDEPKKTEEEITALMESYLEEAKAEVKAGKFYFDAGNGIFHWLFLNGRISIDEDQSDYFYKQARAALPALLEKEKKNTTPGNTGRRSQLEQLIQNYESGQFNDDHELIIQSHAKRLYLNHFLKNQ